MDDQTDNSFASINYSLRPNKTIARKVIFNTLTHLSELLSLVKARYIGMGSIWFMDFVMAHRLLGSTEMISIEADDTAHARACYNAPFGCIAVKHGLTGEILPTLKLSRQVSVVWLDHDTTIVGPAKTDIGTLVDECKEGSVFLVTVNASAKDLRKRINKAEPTKVLAREFQAYLDEELGNDAPRTLSEEDVVEEQFPEVVRGILKQMISSAVRQSGRGLTFLPLFDFVYRDSTPMATVGGILTTAPVAKRVEKKMAAANWPGIVPKMIRVPHLTLREKMSLDRMLPTVAPPSIRSVRKHAGFPLTTDDIKAYHQYYTYYPTFAELQI